MGFQEMIMIMRILKIIATYLKEPKLKIMLAIDRKKNGKKKELGVAELKKKKSLNLLLGPALHAQLG